MINKIVVLFISVFISAMINIYLLFVVFFTIQNKPLSHRIGMVSICLFPVIFYIIFKYIKKKRDEGNCPNSKFIKDFFPLEKKILVFFAALFISIILNFLLLLLVTILAPNKPIEARMMGLSFCLFPILFYTILRHFNKKKYDPSSKYVEILFPPSPQLCNHQSNTNGVFTVSIDFIKKTQISIIKDVLLLLLGYLFIPMLFVDAAIFPSLFIGLKLAIVLVIAFVITYISYKEKLNTTKNKKIVIDNNAIKIFNGSEHFSVSIIDINRVIIKHIKFTDNIDYIQLFRKNSNDITLEGFNDMNTLLNCIVLTAQA